jgi:hypothetical protein
MCFYDLNIISGFIIMYNYKRTMWIYFVLMNIDLFILTNIHNFLYQHLICSILIALLLFYFLSLLNFKESINFFKVAIIKFSYILS